MSDKIYTGTRIMESAAHRAGRTNETLPCFGRHCSGAHELPTPMFYAPPVDDFPQHVTYTFHRGIPLPVGTADQIIMSTVYGNDLEIARVA